MPHLMDKSLNDYIEHMRERYARMTGKLARSKLLDRFCETTGLERKYSIKVLSGQRREKPTAASRRGATRIPILTSPSLDAFYPL